MSKALRVSVLSSLLIMSLSSSISAHSIVNAEKPNTGITVDDNKGMSNIIKGCLISAGLDDITVNDCDNVETIISKYDEITKLKTDIDEISLAKRELKLAKDIITTNNSDANTVAQLLAKCKVEYLENNSITDMQLKLISNDLNIKLNDKQVDSLRGILVDLSNQNYDENNVICDLKTQYTNDTNIILNVLKHIFK